MTLVTAYRTRKLTVSVLKLNLLDLSQFINTKMGFLDILKEFAEETTIHGLVFMAQSKQSVFRRLTWALLFVIFLIYSTFQMKTAIDCKLECPHLKSSV